MASDYANTSSIRAALHPFFIVTLPRTLQR